jgi:probable HAF family extracellular repeat protein
VWRNGETKSLRSAEGSTGVPRAISGDGSTIVGQVGNSACIFREQAPPEYLGSLDGGEQGADANGVSGDGTQIVGSSLTESGHGHAFLWNRREAMLDLGTVDGATGYSSASGISDDGKIIVGSSDNANRPGGLAAVWLERHPRQLFELLLSSGVDLSAWNRLDVVNDVSADGRVLVGDGVLADGSPAGFRVANAPRPANFPPTIDRPEPQRVECSGARNFVTLTARVEDSNPTDRLTVVWFVAGVPVRTERDLIPGQTSTLRYDFPHGETDVHIEASDGTASDRVRTRVTVADTTDPIVVVATDMKSRVDRGKLFATVDLRQPNVSDACDPAPRVTNDAPPNGRFPIGTTKVVWTVRDASGNVVKSVQQVTVVNVNPSAEAGPNRVVRTKNVRAKVRLNGTRSGDVDGHALTYRWHAPGVKFANPTAARTSGLFKRGTTRVTLTVTDAAGAKSSDTMTVRVRKVRTARKSANEADQALRTAYANAFSGGASGLEATAGACLLGAMAGDDIGVESLASVEERLAYSSLRLRQAELASLAASQAYESYLSGADEDALVASLYASYAAASARRDLASEETVDVLVSQSEDE